MRNNNVSLGAIHPAHPVHPERSYPSLIHISSYENKVVSTFFLDSLCHARHDYWLTVNVVDGNGDRFYGIYSMLLHSEQRAAIEIVWSHVYACLCMSGTFFFFAFS